MPTTKPDTDTGWSTAKPEHDGYYWWRFDVADPAAPSEIRDGRVYDFQARGSVLLETLDGEWLGPISPSDFEQLIRLRKSASNALSFLEPILAGIQSEPQPRDGLLSIVESFSDGSYWNHATLNVEDLSNAVAALREALAHKGEQS